MMKLRHLFASSFTPFICLILFFALAIPNNAFAKRSKRKFPHGCRSVGYSFVNRLLVLQPDETNPNPQTLYFIKNTSHHKILLTVEKLPNQIFLPSFNNEIRGNQWGAFATDEKVIRFRCILIPRNGQEETIDCADTLTLCQYNNVKFADNNHGNYWVVNSETLRNTIRTSINKGILLRW